jgi:hypothetical protein
MVESDQISRSGWLDQARTTPGEWMTEAMDDGYDRGQARENLKQRLTSSSGGPTDVLTAKQELATVASRIAGGQVKTTEGSASTDPGKYGQTRVRRIVIVRRVARDKV